MRFLLDTNCWMQVVRDREHAGVVQDLVAAVAATDLAVTDLSLHSVCIAMGRFSMLAEIPRFLAMSRIGREISLISIGFETMAQVSQTAVDRGLDFEDAYQYFVAETYDFILVSLDADFDRTPRGRLTPAQALQRFKDEQQKQS